MKKSITEIPQEPVRYYNVKLTRDQVNDIINLAYNRVNSIDISIKESSSFQDDSFLLKIKSDITEILQTMEHTLKSFNKILTK